MKISNQDEKKKRADPAMERRLPELLFPPIIILSLPIICQTPEGTAEWQTII
jgi:hypothetical protein